MSEPSEDRNPSARNGEGRSGQSNDASSKRRLWRAIAVSGIGVVIGVISLGLFCYALGVNLRDEGWSDRQVDRGLLALSLAGFGVATLMFWVGFISISHSKH